MLAGLEDEGLQIALAQKVIQEGLSVRALEKLAAKPEAPAPAKPVPRPLPLELQDMENKLRENLGLRAVIRGNRKHGKIILQYYNEDELETLYQALEQLEQGR